MAGEPKKKHSKSRKRTRRAAIILKQTATVICKNCGKLTRPHMVCMECGVYAGKAVGKTPVKVTKA